jgi:hypothetical protein
MKILKDITIESYLNYLNSENKTFRKFYSEGINLDNPKYRIMFSDEELIMELIGVEDYDSPELIESPDSVHDFTNSVKIYTWLENLSLADANDSRFWTTLSHVTYENYTKTRWVINRKTTNETLKQRYYYIGGGMQARLRNAISRLWWIPKLTVRDDLEDRFVYTKIVWSSQDLMANLFERSLGTYPNIRFAILKFYSERKYDTKQFRVFYKELNALGAMTPLNLLSENAVAEFLHKVEKVYYPELVQNNQSIIVKEKSNIEDLSSNFNSTDNSYGTSIKEEISHEKQYVFSDESIIVNDSQDSQESNSQIVTRPEVYVKKIIAQDLERTPSISKEAVTNFLRYNIINDGETILLCSFKEKEIEIELKKRKTRDEYRLFLNRHKDLIGYDKEDLLVFRYKSGKLCFEIIKKSFNISQDPRYNDYNSRMGNKCHLLM